MENRIPPPVFPSNTWEFFNTGILRTSSILTTAFSYDLIFLAGH